MYNMEIEETKQVLIPKFPKAVFFVLGNELGERFSYYGMRAVLILYLTRQLQLDATTSKLIFHTSNMLNYFIPLFGALLADIYFGLFKTIACISVVYACGNILLSLVSVPPLELTPKIPLVILALVIIAIGTGGIKPCVAAFGGDQFMKGQEAMRDKFFSIFYFCINIGAALSMILSPIFRADVSCFGEIECYPLAFGFPAILMILATILFFVGKPFYKIFPPRGTAVVDIIRCIWHALKNRRKTAEEKSHWLDYADDRYESSYIEDVRTVLSILLLYLPLPMFSALFDQQGSTWTLQSAKMDGRITDNFEIHPDQMDSLNAILVLVFIPLFSFVLYPLLAKCNLLKTPLQKMCTGGYLAAIAFLVGGFIQLAVEGRLPAPPSQGTNDIMMINTINCPVDVNFASRMINLKAYDFYIFKEVKHAERLNGSLILSKSCKNEMLIPFPLNGLEEFEFELKVKAEKVYSVAIAVTPDGIKVGPPSEQIRKREMSKACPYARIVYTGDKPFPNATLLLRQRDLPAGSSCLQDKGTKEVYQQLSFDEKSTFTNYALIYPKIKSQICWAINNSASCSETPKIPQEVSMYKGGIFEYLLIPSNNNSEMKLIEMMTFSPDSIHILVQTPMYILITAGEVLFSVSGLQFAYSEAPVGMKAILQAASLLTVAFGNVIVIFVVELQENVFKDAKESTYFFIFSALMTADFLVFTFLARRYKYRTQK